MWQFLVKNHKLVESFKPGSCVACVRNNGRCRDMKLPTRNEVISQTEPAGCLRGRRAAVYRDSNSDLWRKWTACRRRSRTPRTFSTSPSSSAAIKKKRRRRNTTMQSDPSVFNWWLIGGATADPEENGFLLVAQHPPSRASWPQPARYVWSGVIMVWLQKLVTRPELIGGNPPSLH